MVAAWLIDPGMRGLGLKDLAWTRLRTEMTRITDLLGTGKTQITMDQVPAAAATAYAGADAAITLQLAQILLPEVAEKGLAHLFRDIEMPLAPVLVAMEAAGVKVDVPFLRQMSVDLTARPAEAGARDPGTGRLRVQRQFDAAALRRAVRQAGPADRGTEEDAGRRLLHSGGCAGRAARAA
jgi:hypothetical protein